ncbi:MAG TPA: sigma 54-interacting transcriptional regulator, partial [Nitrospira sp.]|nr:sigma 54-interacting transcriptional regulator [Nitrospira sp.]
MLELEPTPQDAAVRAILEGLQSEIGEKFFSSLVRQLATVLEVQYAYISEMSEDGSHFRSRVGWGPGGDLPPFQVPPRGPCEAALRGRVIVHPDDLQSLYPDIKVLADWAAKSYCGVPMVDGVGNVLGHLAVLDDKPMPDAMRITAILGVFAGRVSAEIERIKFDAAVRAIVRGVISQTGQEFFPSLVQHLALALNVPYAFVTEFAEDRTRFRSLALWGRGKLTSNFEVPLVGTVCEPVLNGRVSHYPNNLLALFPEDPNLIEWQAVSYCGVPMVDSSGAVIGHFAVLDEKPMPDCSRAVSIMQIFAARAVAEIERVRFEKALADSEERLRDLFDEAPIAYVHEGLDTRFLRANRAAMTSLGINPEEVAGTYGTSFIPDTPEAQRRLHDALQSIGRGTDTRGVVLELRRKDTGKPLWIQWWSKPDPSGQFTRTMFIDITERVLIEQEKARLEAQNVYLQEEIKTQHNFEEIIGTSPSIKKVLKAVEKVAATDATVLVNGETGTGKELIARAIHNLSRRKDRVLVKVNCAAIPAGLIESELFGHEKGAFTGALARKIGRFELADRATIFLDEIGDLPLELQAKLLRVLQEGEFERLGSPRTIKTDVRVIAATNRDLEKSVREGSFRADLFYRLNVFPIRLPALRERTEDIPQLLSYFAKKYGAKHGKRIASIPQSTVHILQSYPWPGNIRELENLIERAVILAQGTQIEIDDQLASQVSTSFVATIA